MILLSAVWAIINDYPSKDKKYIPFMESKEGEKKINRRKLNSFFIYYLE